MAETKRKTVFDCTRAELEAFAALCGALKGRLSANEEDGVVFRLDSKDLWPPRWPSISACFRGRGGTTLFDFASRAGVGPEWLRAMAGASPEEILVRLAVLGFSV